MLGAFRVELDGSSHDCLLPGILQKADAEAEFVSGKSGHVRKLGLCYAKMHIMGSGELDAIMPAV